MTSDNQGFSTVQRHLLVVTLIPMFMTLLSVSIVNVILPSIKHTFEADDSQLQWVVSGYALAFGVLLVAAGRTGDVYGRGRLFVAGLAVFGLGSLLAGLAPNTTVLNIARALTGLGSGALGPQIIGLIQQFFSGSKRGRAFGLFGAVVGVSVAIGPVLGGVLIAVFGAEWGWRASILINVPIAAFAILMSKKWFPAGAWEPVPAADQPAGIQREGVEVSGGRAKADIDPVGITLFGLSVLLVMLPFMEARASAWFWAALPVGLVLLVGWVFWERAYERRGRSPMVDLNLFKTRSFANGTALISVHFTGMPAIWLLVAVYMQNGHGESALAAGSIGLPAAIISAVTSAIAGRHIVRLGRILVLTAQFVVLAGLLGSILVIWMIETWDISVWWLMLPLAFTGGAQGAVISPNQTLTLADVPVQYAGSAGGVMQTGQRVGTAIGLALVTGIVFASVAATGNWDHATMIGFATVFVIGSLATALSMLDLYQSRKERRDRYGA